MRNIGKNKITNMGGDFNYVNCECMSSVKKKKNLFNPSYRLRTSINGLTNVLNSDGSITTTGTATANYTQLVATNSIDNILEDGETYTISQQETNNGVYLQVNIRNKANNATTFNGLADRKKFSFVVNKNVYSYQIMLQTGLMASATDLNVRGYYQLEKGSEATDYEPFYIGG